MHGIAACIKGWRLPGSRVIASRHPPSTSEKTAPKGLLFSSDTCAEPRVRDTIVGGSAMPSEVGAVESLGNADALIATSGLTRRFKGNRGVFDVNLAVQRGEVFGFLGPNGAG